MQLILLFVFLIPAILFLVTQQNVLSLVRPENRQMRPGLVWLQLIPVFNYVWIFFVVARIADSLAKEYAALQSDSILGIADEEAVKAFGKRPTYGIGLAYCILYLIFPFVIVSNNLFVDIPVGNNGIFFGIFAFAIGMLAMGMTVCWIIYWVKLAQYKNKLKRGALAIAA